MMKKVLFVLILALAITAFASDTDQFNIVVTCEFLHFELMQSADHGADFSTWNIGVVSAGDAAITMTTANHIWVENYCNIPVDYSAYVTNSSPSCIYGTPTAWTAGSTTGSDTYVFDLGESESGAWTNILATTSPGNEFNSSVAAGTSYDLFGRFQPPADVADGCEHTITVNVLITAS